MNGLASLLRYQMGGPIGYMSGGPIGYATGGDVKNIYETLFGRAPDEEGLAYYTQELAGVPLSVAFDRIAGGAQGADAAAIEANRDVLFNKIVENIYREQLGRPADEAGKEFYAQQLASGKTATDLSNEIDKTLEGYNFDAERIASNYRQEFGRNPDQEGFQYYMSQEDALVGKADDKAVTDIIRGGVKGVDVQALAAKPETGYTQLQLEALGADPYAGRYATTDPYYFGGVPDDAVNVSRNALDQSIQFTTPVYEQPLVSWFDQDKGFQTTAGKQGDFQQFQAVSGNNVLQREDVENAINLALTSGALDSETAANLRDRIDPASKNKATSWDELYETLKQPKANVVLNAMGVQVGEDVSADVALQEANARKELANIAATNTGGYPSAYYQSVVAQNLANETGKDVNEIYPFTPENLGLGRIDTKKTTADVVNNLGTELGIAGDIGIVKAPPIVTPGTPGTPGGGTLQPGQGSPLTFAPLQRGLGQLRPAAFMPGLLEGSASFGGSGFTPEQLKQATTSLVEEGTVAGKTPEQIYQDFAYLMDVGGVSAAEIAAAIGRAPGEIQGLYNQARPQGLFSTLGPQPYTLPEDFVLQTGASGLAPTPTAPPRETIDAVVDEVNAPIIVERNRLVSDFNDAVARGDVSGAATIAAGSGFTPQEVAEYVNANLGGLGLTDINPNFQGVTAADVLSLEPTWGGTKDPGIAGDFNLAVAQGNYNAAADMARAAGYTPAEIATYVNANVGGLNLPAGSSFTPENIASLFSARQGGMVKYQEGGKVMPKLSAEEAGSTFDSSEFVDEQGRLVGGYNRPIYEDNVLVGYEFMPYGRDVVFGEELRERESRGSSSDELEMALRAMIARQGRTGVSPYTGGLPGIMAREAVMRRRPDYNFAEGGLASVAQDLADKGRFGDTMVAHISPQEAGILKALGGAGTINPETGLPEYFSLFPKKGISLNFGPLGKVKFGRKSSDLLLAAATGYAGATGFMGLNPATAALAYGGVRAAATGNLMEGIQAGLSAYGMGEGMQAYGVGSPAATTGTAATGTGAVNPGAGGVTSANVPIMEQVGTEFAFDPVTGEQLITGSTGAPLLSDATVAKQMAYTPTPEYIRAATAPATEAAKQGFLERTLPAGVKEYTPDFLLEASGPTLATGAVLGGSLIAGQQERAAYAAQQAAINREREEKKKRFADLASRLQQQYPFEYAKGGVASLAGGGMTYMEAGGTTGPTGTPRDVTGTGDGMSDSVPATIEGVQEARLADGEFVIPADVVADIGNGSSDAGSKKLYDMMDRIRKARHGTTEQPPEIQAERLMPA